MPNGRIRTVGEVQGGIIYITKKPAHFFIKYQGFGISTIALAGLLREKIDDVVINYVGVKGIKTYTATVKQFIESDKEHTFTEDGGEDRQKFLSLKEFKVV